jgi:hypothetical protein
MGHIAKVKMAKREARRAMNEVFSENVARVKKELKQKPWWLPRKVWSAIGRALFFKFDL